MELQNQGGVVYYKSHLLKSYDILIMLNGLIAVSVFMGKCLFFFTLAVNLHMLRYVFQIQYSIIHFDEYYFYLIFFLLR